MKFALFLLAASAAAAQTMTKADLDRLMTEVSNWGRWGKDDQLGALNLITPAKRRAALREVREGFNVSLARDVEKERAADNPQPFGHTMWTPANPPTGFAGDSFTVSFHGYAHTHMDGLCHMFVGGKMYNGFAHTEATGAGCTKLTVWNAKPGIVTRGVLLDMARLKGADYLEPPAAIQPEDLDAWVRKAGIKMEPGDVVFLRTGRWARRAAKGPWNVSALSAGFFASSARWLKARDVAMVGSDAASDVFPTGVEGATHPIHQLLLVSMGVHILDNCDLEALSVECAKRKRWTFLLTLAPLAVPGATGSPVNPIATF